MKTPDCIKTFSYALVNLLNPLGLVLILGSFYFQSSYNDYNSEIEDLRKEVLNIRLDNKIGFVSPARRNEAPVCCTAVENVI